jgi:uncharacterized Zn finger protein
MKLSLEYLLKNALPQVFERGKIAYSQKGSILSLIKRGDIFEAEVKGSSMLPYKTAIDLGGPKMNTSCSCPYEQGGHCKHIVAVGLAILDHAFTEGESSSPPELKLSFENIRNIRKEIKRTGDIEHFHAQMNLRIQQEQYIDALKILLGMYESGEGNFRKIWETAEQELNEAFEALSVPIPLAKEMISLIFDRWRKYAGSFQKKADDFTFALEDWGRILLLLAKEEVPRRFLQIRLQGFGLTADFLKK